MANRLKKRDSLLVLRLIAYSDIYYCSSVEVKKSRQ